MNALVPFTAVRVAHKVYGLGSFDRLLAPQGHARVAFDIDGGITRRVLLADLTTEPTERRLVDDAEIRS